MMAQNQNPDYGYNSAGNNGDYQSARNNGGFEINTLALNGENGFNLVKTVMSQPSLGGRTIELNYQ